MKNLIKENGIARTAMAVVLLVSVLAYFTEWVITCSNILN